jgi:hypothetical protein
MESGQLTLFSQETLANLTVLPARDKARMMTVSSGRKLTAYWKPSDPAGLCAKMLLETSHWASMVCLLTWNVVGTPGKRLLFQLQLSEPFTEETGYSLWPTLVASEWRGVAKDRFWGSPTYRSDKLASRFRKTKDDMTHLNPDYAEAFIGFPMGWTVLDP